MYKPMLLYKKTHRYLYNDYQRKIVKLEDIVIYLQRHVDMVKI